MGLPGLENVFHTLDLSRRGYLTVEQIQNFDETLYSTPLCTPQVNASIKDICGSNCNGMVRQEQFVQVLQEMKRRRDLEDQVRWDFMALDSTGNNRLSVQDVLLLFQITQGQQFSMHAWNKFLNSRPDPTADVYFDEVRLWLCNIPDGEPSGDKEKNKEMERLRRLKDEDDENEFSKLQQYQADEYNQTKNNEEYHNQTRRLARKKQYLWEKDGIEALLYDDGHDHGEDVPTRARATLSITDLIDALQHKYDIIRKKLMQEMLQKQYGEAWFSMSEVDQYDAFEQLQMEEKQLRQDGQLSQSCYNLSGAKTTQDAPVDVLMGDNPQDLKTAQAFLKQRVLKMRNDGKLEKDIEMTLREEFKRSYIASSSEKALIALAERFQFERDYYLGQLHSDEEHQVSSSVLSLVYFRLLRQHLMAEKEEQYVPAAVAVGLAERNQGSENSCIDPDCHRQELLAKERLLQKMDREFIPPSIPNITKSNHTSLSDLQLSVVKEMTAKHLAEQEIMIEMLQGKDSTTSKATARKSNYDIRLNRLISLRNARNNWRENITEANTKQHWKILQEAVGLHWVGQFEEQGNKGRSTAELDVNASILADLQHAQDQEFCNLLGSLYKKSEKEIVTLLKLQQHAHVNQLYDNIAAIVMGTYTWSEEEKPIIDALDDKYDVLRQLCLRHALRIEYGLGWFRLSESEKDKLLIKKRVDEKKSRQQGKMLELADLVKLLPKEIGTIRSLLGEDRNEYRKRLTIQDEKIQGMMEKGEKVDRELLDFEELSDKNNFVNLLADLLPRQHAEQDALIGLLRSHDSHTEGDQSRQLPLVLVKTEKWLAKRGEFFDVGALAVGLLERVTGVLNGRHKSDQERQKLLSEHRVTYRLTRIQTGEPYYTEVDTIRPLQGDIQGWMEALLKEVLKKHADEREMFLHLLQDPSMEELHEAAEQMTPQEQTNRLFELRQKKQRLNLEHSDDREENISILEEASAIRTVQVKAQLQLNGSDNFKAAVSVELLIELQHEQDLETAKLIERLARMTEEELRINREHHINCRHHGAGDHAIVVLTHVVGSAEDSELIEALEEKYEVLIDKLLLEALIRQVGEADWLRMSELERQRRLTELKLQARKLQKQGDEDGLARLLNQRQEDDELLSKLMGDNRADFERKLREKLARRNKQGLTEDEEDLEEEKVDDDKVINPLTALDDRFDKERDALFAQLRGTNEKMMTERERQMALIRLRREKRKAEQEGSFNEMAMMMGLAERQQCDLMDRLKNDRKRQEEMAKKKLEAIRKKKIALGKLQKVPEVITEGDKTILQDITMQKLDEKHENERTILVALLSKSPSTDHRKRLAASNELERQEMRNNLQKKWEKTKCDHVKDSITLLQEACYAKSESCRQQLIQESEGADISKDDIDISLMADLQDLQDAEAESYLQAIVSMEENKLIEVQKKILNEIRYQRGQCLVNVMFGTENQGKHGDNEVIDALEAKYDALREKLFLEALEKKVGEKAWKKMSDDERNRQLMELRLQVKKLRQEGRLEEAAALLGETIDNHDTLDDLVGENRAQYEKILQERLEKRKKRLAEGISEEECDRLEAEEAKEERKKKKNILQDLEDNFEKERDSLLNALKQQKDLVAAEKERQLQLVKLHKDQRRAQLENEYEAAALAIDLGKEHKQAFEENRLKQEQLARERLNAKLRQRQNKAKKPEPIEEEVDEDDPMSLIASISEKVDIKHSNERDVLIQFFQDVTLTDRVRAASGRSEAECSERLEELCQLRESWRQLEGGEPIEQIKLFKEGLCLHLAQLHTVNDDKKSDVDLHVALLADLQDIQDKETQELLHNVENQTPYVLRRLRMAQMLAIKRQWHDNLVPVVLGAPTVTSADDELIQALKEKYDAVRDKLFMEVLIKEIGASKWDKLSKQEQQKLLINLKVHHSHLQREGKSDEAAALLLGLEERGVELQQKFGESCEDENKRALERQKRYDQLVEERTQNNLPVDDAMLNAILDQEEKEGAGKSVKRKNILDELEHHFEDEKAALLKQLSDQESQLDVERLRQLELLRLRRQKKQLEMENKVDSAAILLNMAEQHEKARQESQGIESMNQEMERQRALAKERLDAMRMRKKKKTSQSELEKQLKEEQNELEAQQVTDSINKQKEGDVAMKEAVLLTVERKHHKERDMLEELIIASKDKSAIAESTKVAKNLGNEDTLDQLEKLQQEWNSWQSRTRRDAMSLMEKPDELSAQAKDKHIKDITQNRMEAFHLMTQALVLKTEVEKHRMRELGKDAPDIDDEVLVTLISDLHQKQEAEARATEGLVMDQSPDVIQKLNESQQMAAQEGWYNNLASVLFSVGTTASVPQPDERAKQKQEADLYLLLDKMQNEFDQERINLQEKLEDEVKNGAEINMDEEMNKLISQQEARKKDAEKSMSNQQEQAKLEIEAKQYVLDNQSYEDDVKQDLLRVIEDNDSDSIPEGTENNMLQQKLAERRERRHRDQAAAERVPSSTALYGMHSRLDHTPDLAISRERTVIDVSLSEDQKNELYTQLMQQQTALNKKLEIEHRRHEDQLKERLERMKEKRTTEAADLMKMAERQKTTLEKLQHGEHERQIAATKERVARLRYEKTQTMRELGNENTRKFGEYLNDKELSGMSEDDKMQAVAKKMEEKFKQEDGGVDGAQGDKRLSQEEKLQMLKERRERKKKKRQETHAVNDVQE